MTCLLASERCRTSVYLSLCIYLCSLFCTHNAQISSTAMQGLHPHASVPTHRPVVFLHLQRVPGSAVT